MGGIAGSKVLTRISVKIARAPSISFLPSLPASSCFFLENGMTRVQTGSMDLPMKTLLLLTLIVAPLLLSGCNTVKGLGEDISGSASWTQDKISGTGDSSVKKSDSDYVNPPQFPKSN